MTTPVRRPSLSFESPVGSGTRPRARPREASRREMSLEVTFTTDDGDQAKGLSRDMGIGGMFILTGKPAAYGTGLKLVISVPTIAKPLEIGAVVRWMCDEGMGVQFNLMGAQETYEITRLMNGSRADMQKVELPPKSEREPSSEPEPQT